LEIARETGSRIVGPTFARTYHRALLEDGEVQVQNDSRDSDISANENQMELSKLVNNPNALQFPVTNCDYRHTDFVELTAPLIRSDVLETILLRCQNCIGRNSDWGLDMMWCNYLSETTNSRACALVDATPVVHLDWMLATVTEQFRTSLETVRAAYGKYWSHRRTLSCMHHTSVKSPVDFAVRQRNNTGMLRAAKMPGQQKDVHQPQTVANKSQKRTAKMVDQRQTLVTGKHKMVRQEVVHSRAAKANPTKKVAHVMLQDPGSENLHEELPQLTVTHAAGVAKPLATLHDAAITISDKASVHRANLADSSSLLALSGSQAQKATAKILATQRSSSKAAAMQVQVQALKEELASERAKELSDMRARIKELEAKMAKDHQMEQAVIQAQQKKIKDLQAQVDEENRVDRMDELKASLDAERQDGIHLREKIENLEAQLRVAFETVANLQKANQASRHS